MRRPIAIAVVFLAVLLLGIDVGLHIGQASESRSALAQANPAGMIIAAAGIQNDAFCFLYNPATKQLISYRQRPIGSGLELQGIRTCGSDFNPKFREYPKTKSSTAVRKMKSIDAELAKKGK